MDRTHRRLLFVSLCLLTLWTVSPGGAPPVVGEAGRLAKGEARTTTTGQGVHDQHRTSEAAAARATEAAGHAHQATGAAPVPALSLSWAARQATSGVPVTLRIQYLDETGTAAARGGSVLLTLSDPRARVTEGSGQAALAGRPATRGQRLRVPLTAAKPR